MRSIVLREKRTASPVVGCFHDLLASSSMRLASSPGSGGEASSWPMIEKRRRAHRRRAGACSSWLIGSSWPATVDVVAYEGPYLTAETPQKTILSGAPRSDGDAHK